MVGRPQLVNAQYLHLPLPWRIQQWERLASAVAPGGTLLVVAHDRDDPHVVEFSQDNPELFFDGAEVVDALPGDGWTVVTDTVVIRRRPGHDQPAHDLVVRAVRTP